MNKKKLQLLVCCHKAYPQIRTEEPYLPIQAGKELNPELDLGFICDNEGENISSKNPVYSEMTVLYWGWKNIKDVEYLGLCHYRRYFEKLNIDNIDELLKGKDIIAVKSEPQVSCMERADNLISCISKEDFYIFIDTVLSLHPDCKDALIKYFYRSRVSYPFTMFVAKKELYDQFCEFIFPVFFEMEKKLKGHGYSRLNRTIAYCGEWSLGLFIFYKKLRVKKLPIHNEATPKDKGYKRVVRLAYRTLSRFMYLFIDLKALQIHTVQVPDAVRVGFKNDGIELNVL